MAETERKTQKLNALYLFKEGMSRIYNNETGEALPVTVLRYEPHIITQIKSSQKEGYEAVQVAVGHRSSKKATKAILEHSKASQLLKPGKLFGEIKVKSTEGLQLGDVVAIDSLTEMELVKVTGISKGKGFAGSVKRFGFRGGPASHGSKFHRQPGSSGNRTWPGRIMPGKKFPGHLGDRTVSIKNLQIIKVDPQNNVVLVKGAVPGSRNSVVLVSRGEQ